jgi:hypothetical protein
MSNAGPASTCGDNQPFTATATLSNGTTQDLRHGHRREHNSSDGVIDWRDRVSVRARL